MLTMTSTEQHIKIHKRGFSKKLTLRVHLEKRIPTSHPTISNPTLRLRRFREDCRCLFSLAKRFVRTGSSFRKKGARGMAEPAPV